MTSTSGPYDATGTSSPSGPVAYAPGTAALAALSHIWMTSAVLPGKPSHPSRPPN